MRDFMEPARGSENRSIKLEKVACLSSPTPTIGLPQSSLTGLTPMESDPMEYDHMESESDPVESDPMESDPKESDLALQPIKQSGYWDLS